MVEIFLANHLEQSRKVLLLRLHLCFMQQHVFFFYCQHYTPVTESQQSSQKKNKQTVSISALRLGMLASAEILVRIGPPVRIWNPPCHFLLTPVIWHCLEVQQLYSQSLHLIWRLRQNSVRVWSWGWPFMQRMYYLFKQNCDIPHVPPVHHSAWTLHMHIWRQTKEGVTGAASRCQLLNKVCISKYNTFTR